MTVPCGSRVKKRNDGYINRFICRKLSQRGVCTVFARR